MFQIRIHGRGGQGCVTGAEMLSIAAFREGKHAQAFPSFGSERTGAPVVAFCRISDREIRLREPIMQPDGLIIQDPTLLFQVDVFSGLVQDGYVLINTKKRFDDLGVCDRFGGWNRARLCTVPATEIAMEHIGRPLPNAILLAGFAAITGTVSLASVQAAIEEKFSGKVAAGNVAAASAAYEYVKKQQEDYAHAETV